MPVHNSEIAEIFNETADLVEIEGANEFRVRAYREAAGTIDRLPKSFGEMVEKGEDLTQLSGIGDDLAGKIREIISTGKLRQLEEIERRTPLGLRDLLDIKGLGPKRVRKLYEGLGTTGMDELQEAAQKEKIRDGDWYPKEGMEEEEQDQALFEHLEE